MKRRILETLVLLGLAAVLASMMRREPEPGTRPSREDLTIDGIYPGMALSEVERHIQSPSTVFGTAGVYDSQRSVSFVYGDTVLRDGIPCVQKGDTEERVYQELGRPDRVRDHIWTYEGKFALGFQDARLIGIFSDQSYINSSQGHYFIECTGLSHCPPNYFYGLVGESSLGDSALVLVPSLTLATQSFYFACNPEQVILPGGRVYVGQSLQSALDSLSGNEVERVEGKRIYTFTDFTLAFDVTDNRVFDIVVEPRLLNPEPGGIEPEGILDLIGREP